MCALDLLIGRIHSVAKVNGKLWRCVGECVCVCVCVCVDEKEGLAVTLKESSRVLEENQSREAQLQASLKTLEHQIHTLTERDQSYTHTHTHTHTHTRTHTHRHTPTHTVSYT